MATDIYLRKFLPETFVSMFKTRHFVSYDSISDVYKVINICFEKTTEITKDIESLTVYAYKEVIVENPKFFIREFIVNSDRICIPKTYFHMLVKDQERSIQLALMLNEFKLRNLSAKQTILEETVNNMRTIYSILNEDKTVRKKQKDS